jgi:SAM-dependent methyltransferase
VTDDAARLDANRAMWDERVPIHVASTFYDVEGFVAGRTQLRSFEPDELGDVRGLDLVHLQCHFGLDSLDWARRGARVTGLDFSPEAVDAARRLATRCGIDADFVQADVYDAVDALGGRTFDVVYTGIGALIWLPDIHRWAEVVARLLRPGGRLYLVEFHPLVWVFGDEDLTFRWSYFQREPAVWDEPGTYADRNAATVHNLSYEWHHTMGDVVTAVADVGLRIHRLVERPTLFDQRWPFLVQHGSQDWRLPDGMPAIPLSYSVLATKG